jgi:aryl-alcohol dehydrogenase-like predicted oxidoreductase
MEYRNLGRTGLEVSPLCLGAMMFGAWGNRDHDESIRIIHAALDAGINVVDTSNNYSNGESETIVGKALAGGKRENVVLATKVYAPMGEGPNQRGLSRKAIQEQVHASLRRLGTDVIDLYQIHRPDPKTPWEETLSTLDDLVRQGKIRYLGCSTNHYSGEALWEKRLPAWEIVETLQISERHGYERFVSLQPPYSILRRVMESDHFPMCERFGIGNIVWSPLEGGWLSGKYRRDTKPGESPRLAWIGDPDDPKFDRRRKIVVALLPMAESHGVSLARFAHAWALRHPAVTSVILGPRTMEQLTDSLACLDVTIRDSAAEEIDRLVPPGTAAL